MSIDEFEGTAAAPPRDNGELVFSEPWQARAFGLAADLASGGHFTWDEFRAHLIEVIARSEHDSPALTGLQSEAATSEPPQAWDYYQCWLEALERAVTSSGLLEVRALADRSQQYADRPHGHDHSH